jgi:hypothetical protein
MFQLYLLTVLANILAGLTLSSTYFSEKFPQFSDFSGFMSNQTYRLILAIISIIVGIANIFPTYEGDIVFFGELLPFIAGVTAGILLLVDFVSTRQDLNMGKTAEIADKVERISKPYLTIVGIIVVIIGMVHALIPQVPVF